MFTLAVSFEITLGKRHEFLQTARSLLRSGDDGDPAGEVGLFERVTTPARFLWSERFDSSAKLERRLHSSTIQTLLGAIDVLGRVESIEVFEGQSRPEILNKELPDWAAGI